MNDLNVTYKEDQLQDFADKFSSLDRDHVDAVGSVLRAELDEMNVTTAIRQAIKRYGSHNWIHSTEFGHFGWGMACRNWLREQGYGEKFLHVDNLDDYYVALVEYAVTMEWDD